MGEFRSHTTYDAFDQLSTTFNGLSVAADNSAAVTNSLTSSPSILPASSVLAPVENRLPAVPSTYVTPNRDFKAVNANLFNEIHHAGIVFCKRYGIDLEAAFNFAVLADGRSNVPAILLQNPKDHTKPYSEMVNRCDSLQFIRNSLEKIGISVHEVPILDACPLLDDAWIKGRLGWVGIDQAVKEAFDVTAKILGLINPTLIICAQCATSWGARKGARERRQSGKVLDPGDMMALNAPPWMLDMGSSMKKAGEKGYTKHGSGYNLVYAFHPSHALKMEKGGLLETIIAKAFGGSQDNQSPALPSGSTLTSGPAFIPGPDFLVTGVLPNLMPIKVDLQQSMRGHTKMTGGLSVAERRADRLGEAANVVKSQLIDIVGVVTDQLSKILSAAKEQILNTVSEVNDQLLDTIREVQTIHDEVTVEIDELKETARELARSNEHLRKANKLLMQSNRMYRRRVNERGAVIKPGCCIPKLMVNLVKIS